MLARRHFHIMIIFVSSFMRGALNFLCTSLNLAVVMEMVRFHKAKGNIVKMEVV